MHPEARAVTGPLSAQTIDTILEGEWFEFTFCRAGVCLFSLDDYTDVMFIADGARLAELERWGVEPWMLRPHHPAHRLRTSEPSPAGPEEV